MNGAKIATGAALAGATLCAAFALFHQVPRLVQLEMERERPTQFARPFQWNPQPPSTPTLSDMQRPPSAPSTAAPFPVVVHISPGGGNVVVRVQHNAEIRAIEAPGYSYTWCMRGPNLRQHVDQSSSAGPMLPLIENRAVGNEYHARIRFRPDVARALQQLGEPAVVEFGLARAGAPSPVNCTGAPPQRLTPSATEPIAVTPRVQRITLPRTGQMLIEDFANTIIVATECFQPFYEQATRDELRRHLNGIDPATYHVWTTRGNEKELRAAPELRRTLNFYPAGDSRRWIWVAASACR